VTSAFRKLVLWKENLNGDGQQLHQYQQDDQPPHASNNWTKKKIITYKIHIYTITQITRTTAEDMDMLEQFWATTDHL